MSNPNTEGVFAMTSYRVYLRSDLQWAVRAFEADTPEQALELARRFADDHFDELDFESYQGGDCPLNEIEVCDDTADELAIWRDDDLRLRLAAQDLLDAGRLVVDRCPRIGCRYREGGRGCAMTPRTIEIAGKRYLWRDIVALRRAQLAAARQAHQPVLFELIDDCRPSSQRTAAGRYSEPMLFEAERRRRKGHVEQEA